MHCDIFFWHGMTLAHSIIKRPYGPSSSQHAMKLLLLFIDVKLSNDSTLHNISILNSYLNSYKNSDAIAVHK